MAASLICWENYMPLARFHLYAQGPEIWVAPTLATMEAWVATMRHIAREGVCFVIGVAPVMHPDWLPDTLPDTAPLRSDAENFDGWILDGYSVIVDPTGQVLAGPLVQERGILFADLDLEMIAARKRMFDATGHYNRPDIFRLHVDDRPKPAVVRRASATETAPVRAANGDREPEMAAAPAPRASPAGGSPA